MKIKNKFTGLILCLALSAASLTGCGGEKASEPVRSEAVQDTAKTDKKADTDKKETKAEKKNDKNALTCIEENLKHTGLNDKAGIYKQDVFVSLQSLEYKYEFDIVFMDPPYDKELERRVLEYLTMSKLIHEDTLIIFEASLDTDISYLEDLGYELIKEKKYKTNKHVFVQRSKR